MSEKSLIDLPKIGLSGEFRLVLKNPDESIAQDTGWFKNTVVDQGLTRYGSTDSGCMSNCQIGSGSGATVTTQTDLNSLLASNPSRTSISTSPTPSAPDYEFWEISRWRFTAGTGTGTIREVGLASSSQPYTGKLFCRQEVSPEIVKNADQVLDVFYRFTVYPFIGSNSGTVVIDGITYDWVCSQYYLNNNLNPQLSVFTNGGRPNTYYIYNDAYSGVAATALQTQPSGTNLGSAGTSSSDGTASIPAQGLGYCEMEVTWGLSVGNGTDYIRTITWRQVASKLHFQCQFTQQAGQPNPGEGIPKDNTEELTTRIRVNWGRYTP